MFPLPGRFALALTVAAALATTGFAADPIVVPAAEFARTPHPDMGANLEQVTDYSRSMMFVDTMKSGRHFGSPDQPWDEKADVDEHGWPKGDAGVVLMADVPVAPGDYTFTCKGKCDLGLVNTKGAVKDINYNANTKTTTATVAINPGATNLFLSFKGTSGGVQDVQLLRPGYKVGGKDVFTKEFLTAIAPFSTLRTMDATRTNQSEVADWKERPLKTDTLQTSERGIAWEYIIELANTAKKDIWINVPDRATDDYVKQLATLLNGSLDKDRHVYVEYSNEVWNGSFRQAGRNQDAAKAEVAAGNKMLSDDGKDDNQYYWAWKRVSKRTMEIAAIFKDVVGADAMNNRVRPVLASQAANSFMTRMQLEFIEKNYGAPAKFIYGIAGAPYLGPEEKVANKEAVTADELLKAMTSNPWPKQATEAYLLLARYYRVHHLCYEGGMAIEGEKNLAAKLEANRDPRLAPVISDYFNMWYGQGGELFMYYNLAGGYTKYGCWGLTDDIRVLGPKFKAVADFANKAPLPITVGAALPGVIAAWKPDSKDGGGVEDSADGGKNLAYLQEGHTFDYLLNVKDPGVYTMTIQAAAGGSGSKLRAFLSGVELGAIEVPNTGGGQKWGSTEGVRVKLERGQLVLRLRVAVAGMNVRSVTFTKG